MDLCRQHFIPQKNVLDNTESWCINEITVVAGTSCGEESWLVRSMPNASGIDENAADLIFNVNK
jgi:hypothetical protein